LACESSKHRKRLGLRNGNDRGNAGEDEDPITRADDTSGRLTAGLNPDVCEVYDGQQQEA
jgi:hypothetical protein